MEETQKEYNLQVSEDGTAVFLDCDLSTVEFDTLVGSISKELEELGGRSANLIWWLSRSFLMAAFLSVYLGVRGMVRLPAVQYLFAMLTGLKNNVSLTPSMHTHTRPR